MERREFERLPALVTRKVFMQLTGLSAKDLYAMAQAGELRVFERPWRARGQRSEVGGRRPAKRRRPCWLYYRCEAERFLKLA